MCKDSKAGDGVTIGLDLGDEFSQAYVITADGKWVEDFRSGRRGEGFRGCLLAKAMRLHVSVL